MSLKAIFTISNKCLRCDRLRKCNPEGYCKTCDDYFKRKNIQDALPKKKCECLNPDCKKMIPIKTINGAPNHYAPGHNTAGKRGNRYKGRFKANGYWRLLKKHYPFSNPKGNVYEHRYIMYIYLSILNNKITYISKGYDVHHKNGNRLDNRIENLELIQSSTHSIIHQNDGNYIPIDGRTCYDCGSEYTEYWSRIDYLIGKYRCDKCVKKYRYHEILKG